MLPIFISLLQAAKYSDLILPILEAAIYFSFVATLVVATAASAISLFWVAYVADFHLPFASGEILRSDSADSGGGNLLLVCGNVSRRDSRVSHLALLGRVCCRFSSPFCKRRNTQI